MDTHATTSTEPQAVEQELTHCRTARDRAYALSHDCDEQRAPRCLAIAETFDHEADCWARLADWVYSGDQCYGPMGAVLRPFGKAVLCARDEATESAHKYRELAHSATERSQRKAVSA